MNAQTWGFYQSRRNGYAPTKWHLAPPECGIHVSDWPQEKQTIRTGSIPKDRYKLGICSRCLQKRREG